MFKCFSSASIIEERRAQVNTHFIEDISQINVKSHVNLNAILFFPVFRLERIFFAVARADNATTMIDGGHIGVVMSMI